MTDNAELVVKPLEWQKVGTTWWSAMSVGGEYLVERVFWQIGDNDFTLSLKVGAVAERLDGGFPTLEQAKAAAQADYELRILSALAPSLHQPAPEAGIAWRCFHCDEVFTDEQAARDHFGRDEGKLPACQIKAGAERSLVKALRRVEADNDDLMFRLQNECTDAAKAYHAQTARHHGQLLAAEEAGYERGLNDAAPAPEPQAPVPDGVTEIERYSLFTDGWGDELIGLRSHPAGEWVKFDAHVRALTAANERSR